MRPLSRCSIDLYLRRPVRKVVRFTMDLKQFLRKQAEQILELARKTSDPELRRQLESLARTWLAELELVDKTTH
jgi:hypothetical protein